MKKLIFAILLLLSTASANAGILYDTALFKSDGTTVTPKYGLLLSGSLTVGISPVTGGTSGYCMTVVSGILQNQSCGSVSSLTVGTTAIVSGTTGYLLYNNAGILGNLNPAGLTLAWGQITSTPTTISGYGITDGLKINFSNVTGTLPIANGGTGQTTANAALNAILPSQTSNSGNCLQTDSSNTSWSTCGSGISLQALTSTNDITTPNTKVSFSFTSLYVGTHYLSPKATTIVDTSVVGVNGLDTGSQSASTWYYLYAITNSTGSTVQGILSASSTAPSPMPTGFTQYRLISSYRSDASTHFLLQIQFNDLVHYFTGGAVVTNGTNTTSTTVACNTLAPPIVREVELIINTSVILTATGQTATQTQITGTTGFITRTNATYVSPNAIRASDDFPQVLDSSQQFDYKIIGSITSGGITIGLYGYHLLL